MKNSENIKTKDRKWDIMKLGLEKGDRIDEKHYHLHLYHHLCKDREQQTNETEPSKQASKVSGVNQRVRAHTESRDEDTVTTTEIAAVSGINDLKRIAAKNELFKESNEDSTDPRKHLKLKNKDHIRYENSKEMDESKESTSDDDNLDEEVLETIVRLGYPLEEVLRLIEEEDEDMINLYLKVFEELQNQHKVVYPSYMRSKVSDWKNYAFLLASPENSSSRSRKDKSRNNRVLSYSPKRNNWYPHPETKQSSSGSRGKNAVRFSFYPKENSPNRDDSEGYQRNRKLLGSRKFSPE